MFSVIGILASYVSVRTDEHTVSRQLSRLIEHRNGTVVIMATQALAVLIFSIFPKIAYIISVGVMVGSLGLHCRE